MPGFEPKPVPSYHICKYTKLTRLYGNGLRGRYLGSQW